MSPNPRAIGKVQFLTVFGIKEHREALASSQFKYSRSQNQNQFYLGDKLLYI